MLKALSLIAILAPLIGAAISGLACRKISKVWGQSVTIAGIAIALASSIWLAVLIFSGPAQAHYLNIYTWVLSGSFHFNVGFMLDHLTVLMMLIVTFVSLLVHIYSVGYMKGDSGYNRFFSYMSLFTFMMLMLVMANNFAQLFFGWEGVGLVSYLLIGFWFKKDSAVVGSLKAFIVNRVGDFGFILGIAAVLDYFGTLKYKLIFPKAYMLAHTTMSIFPHTHWSVLTVMCILLFIGAMGKSAQMPLHVWLPESMEGPTPISALIHAATMVTAGVFMVARLSPMFIYSPVALSVVLIIGATGALFTGCLALNANDIKRVIAFSTMSQLGYMMAANGASAFSGAIFHLMTHAGFKALLFLAAGSVIIAMHHKQDMREMGGLKKYLPITYWTFLIGALALAAIPPFSGYYSKDAIIDAVGLSHVFGHTYAYWCLLLGGFITALYIFRAFFMTFHGEERLPAELKGQVKESPWSMTIPLILLAIPSVLIGGLLAKHMLYSGSHNILASSIVVNAKANTLAILAHDWHGAWFAILQAFVHAPFWFAIAGIVVAWFGYRNNKFPAWMATKFSWVTAIINHQYGFDAFNDWVFVKGVRKLASVMYHVGDEKILDDGMVNGAGRGIEALSRLVKRMQSGYLYHYAFVMVLALVVFLIWKVV